ncbi:hypothetical protein QQG55_16190 [Brugia pahangi]
MSTTRIIFIIISVVFVTSALPTDTKQEKQEKIGPCVNNLCPVEYKCISNECIKNQTPSENLTKGRNVGPCINGLCPEEHTCYNDLCYNTNMSVNV